MSGQLQSDDNFSFGLDSTVTWAAALVSNGTWTVTHSKETPSMTATRETKGENAFRIGSCANSHSVSRERRSRPRNEGRIRNGRHPAERGPQLSFERVQSHVGD